MARIAIIGLGLIGGSLGLALKAAKHKDLEIVGYDEYDRTAKRARKAGALDSTARRARDAVERAGLVIVAVPPASVESVFQEIAPGLARGVVVTDTASTKAQIMKWAEQHLPDFVSFVGGHPMAGKTEQGIENAEANLFHGAPYAVVPSQRASDEAVKSVLGMIKSIGAQELFVSADEHDQYVGGVSHLPVVVSLALFTMLRSSQAWPDFAKISGPAYRDLTRLVSGNPQMSTDILVTNRENVQYWLDRYIVELRRLRDLLDDSEEAIFRELAQAGINRVRYLAGEDRDQSSGPEIPSSADQMASLMFSPKLYERIRDMIRASEKRAEEAGSRRP